LRANVGDNRCIPELNNVRKNRKKITLKKRENVVGYPEPHVAAAMSQ